MQSPYATFAPRRCLAPSVFSGASVLTTDSTVLFVDLAGFTVLTEKLAQHGTRGTEELSEHVGAFFSSITQQVTDYDGDLLGYGGDALTITFEGEPVDAIKRAELAAGRVHDLAQEMSGRRTLAGPIQIAARIGIAHGPVASAVAVSSQRHTPLHLGPTLDKAVAAESRARQGQTVVSGVPRPGETLTVTGSLQNVSEAGFDTSNLHRLVHPTVGEHFERRAGAPTSHRALTAAFVAYPPVGLPDISKFQRRISKLVDIVVSQGGEVIQVSGGDKGVVAFVVFGAP